MVILVDRANYGRMWPVMKAIQRDPELELLTVCAGTMLLERFGQAEHVVQRDGFKVDGRVFLEVEGSVPATMAKSVGLGVIEFSTEFQRLDPDIVLLIGDRYEALAASVAAAYMNVPIAHIQGGEASGSIDESTRHAITKFAHLHFPATDRSAEYIIRMGEDPAHVHNVGCPSGDYILHALGDDLPPDLFRQVGVGGTFAPDDPFLLVIYHPVTTRFSQERARVEELLQALDRMKHRTVWLWPNIDAGSDDISKALRVYREHNDDAWLHLIKNLEPPVFQKLLKRAACAVGNSSSFVRDSTFSGTPVVLVGDRQAGREWGANLMNVEPEARTIEAAVRAQLSHGRYPASHLYGNGTAASQIVAALRTFTPYPQKRLSYLEDHAAVGLGT
ncbi:MAG: UDP-N-acetylglucosamine 2-epimerase [Gemmatimonadota bacterium]